MASSAREIRQGSLPAPVCPACDAALPAPPSGLAPACPGCRATFRSPLVAAFFSAALPGSGHLYLRRRLLGGCELTLGLALFIAGLINLLRVFMRVLDETAQPLDLLRACLPWALVLASYSLFDGLFTWLVSRRRVVLSVPRRSAP